MLSFRQLAPLAVVALGSCAPPMEMRGADLSSIRIGAGQRTIEARLGTPPAARRAHDRTVVAYRYGPALVQAESLVCPPMPPSIAGTLVFCPAMAAFFGATRESLEHALQTGNLLVVYDPNGIAEWVVFGSTASELENAVSWINLAGCGDAAAAMGIATSLAAGTNGFPLDRPQALFWATIASRHGAATAEALRQRVQARIPIDEAEAIIGKADAWKPADTCNVVELPHG